MYQMFKIDKIATPILQALTVLMWFCILSFVFTQTSKAQEFDESLIPIITNTKLADMTEGTLKMRNTASTGDPQDTKISELTEDAAPASGGWFIFEQPGGELRKVDSDNMPGSGGSGDMLAANNLSDLVNAATSRTNLGVEIGVDVQAFSAVLAATTASFLTADETKLDFVSITQAVDLDTIESDTATNNAKVTADTTNVTAAGALMDSEVTNLAQVKAFDSSDYATAAQGATADSALQSYTVTEGDVTTHQGAINHDALSNFVADEHLASSTFATAAQGTLADNAVANTGDETIAGVKTFSSSPIVPAPTTDLQAATKKYVDDNAGGGGASELSDLSDVNTSTATNRNVLVADGVDWESRALLASDISDLNTSAIAVQAYLTADQAIAAGVPEDLTGFTEVLDSGADFNATTGEFTVPVSGRYLFTFAATFGVGSDGDLLTIIIEDSGAATNLHRKREAASGTLNQTVSTSTSLDLTVSDVIVFNVENDDNNDDVQLGQTNTSISITYLGTAVYAGAENAADLSVDASGFSGNLTTSENTAQKVAAAVDTLNVSGRPVMAMLGINSTAQSVNATSRTELDFLENTGEYFVDAGITHSTSTNPERIEVDVDSRCEVSGGIGTTGSTSNYRYQGVTSIAINGGSARDGYGDGYIRVSSGANSTTVKVLDVFDITGGQYFTVGIARTNTTSGNATTEANKTKLIVKCWAD